MNEIEVKFLKTVNGLNSREKGVETFISGTNAVINESLFDQFVNLGAVEIPIASETETKAQKESKTVDKRVTKELKTPKVTKSKKGDK